MAPVAEDVAGGQILDAQFPDALCLIPPSSRDLVTQLDEPIEFILPGNVTEVLKNLWGFRVAFGTS